MDTNQPPIAKPLWVLKVDASGRTYAERGTETIDIRGDLPAAQVAKLLAKLNAE